MAIGFMSVFSKAVWPALCLLAFSPWSYAASSVTVSGVLGEKALIAIGSGPAKVMAVGDTIQGIRLLAVQGQQVVIEEGGKRRTLQVGFGFTPGGASESASVAVITADGRGQFFTAGEVNGNPVRFLVDTGASVVTLPRSLAIRAGVALDNAKSVTVSTANGRARASRVLLNTVRVGGVTANMVEAIIMEDAQLPVALLGMSFLKRTNMKNEGDRLTLSQRY
ncbi:MAG: TIGR02281 family clan AA aspartic protease [Pseudomonadota bacterium]|nr:TIGR02281 family clan AA aspartic protease [Pseudomonadota bacterium]